MCFWGGNEVSITIRKGGARMAQNHPRTGEFQLIFTRDIGSKIPAESNAIGDQEWEGRRVWKASARGDHQVPRNEPVALREQRVVGNLRKTTYC